MSAAITVACPCGGHSFSLAPDKPPAGGRAAFTCPACGLRRTFTRTETGVVFDALPGVAPETPAMAAPNAPNVPDAPRAPATAPAGKYDAALLPAPRTVPAGAPVAIVALGDPAWRQAADAAFPAPDWHVLDAAPDAGQNCADVRGLAPAVVVADDGATGRELADAVAALPGRQRERMVLIRLGAPAADKALAAFAVAADAVCDSRETKNAATRLRGVWERARALPSLFTAT